MATIARGDVGWVDDVASRIEEVAGAGCIVPKAGEAVETGFLTLKVFEMVEVEDVEADGEDTLHEARTGAECVEVTRGHKGPTAGNPGVKARNCEGAGRVGIIVRDVG